MAFGISDSDRERCADILESRRKMGSKKPRDDNDRVTLGETGFGPEREVIVSGGRWALDCIFHLSDECHHLQGDQLTKEVRQLNDGWTLCWHCEQTEYEK